MFSFRFLFAATFVFLCSNRAAVAQEITPGSGTVQGTITLADTQKPARLVKVVLTPVKNDNEPTLKALGKAGAANDPGAALGALMGSMTMLSAQTDLDGHYELAGVTPGDYYVLANISGYISPAAAAALSKGATSLEGAPKVHVDANKVAHGDQTLERGAVITGTATYDDGTPIPDVAITVEAWSTIDAPKPPNDPTKVNIGQAMTMAMAGGVKVAATDDLGHYRVAGLPAGEYRVHLVLSTGGSVRMRNGVMDLNSMKGVSPIMIYSPAAMHERDAEKVAVKSGDDRNGVDLRVGLTGLPIVSGRVTSATDHHAVNSGRITLTDTSDKNLKRTGAIAPDGSFTIAYVPSGSYTLTVAGAADTEAGPKQQASGLLNFQHENVVRRYAEFSQPEIVEASDLSGLNLELKEIQPETKSTSSGNQ